METLPPVPTSLETLQPSATVAPTTIPPVETTGAPLIGTVSPAPLESTERVELSVVEKMVIGVAIAITIILIGILVSVSTKP
jgi:hypothetical protein